VAACGKVSAQTPADADVPEVIDHAAENIPPQNSCSLLHARNCQ
jgi:hypothetical protein